MQEYGISDRRQRQKLMVLARHEVFAYHKSLKTYKLLELLDSKLSEKMALAV